jgi:hypothetical protein
MSILTQEHEEEVWGRAIEEVEATIDALLDTMGEEHPLYDRVAGVKVVLNSLDGAHEQCMESSFDRGELAGQRDAIETERLAHEQVGAVVERWMPRVKQFCERVKVHLGPELLDEPVSVHDIRMDIHDIPRGWV